MLRYYGISVMYRFSGYSRSFTQCMVGGSSCMIRRRKLI